MSYYVATTSITSIIIILCIDELGFSYIKPLHLNDHNTQLLTESQRRLQYGLRKDAFIERNVLYAGANSSTWQQSHHHEILWLHLAGSWSI